MLEACGARTTTYTRKGKEITATFKNGRDHLRPLIITALDTGMRRGELFKLCWRDVDLEAQSITITALNSKTAQARYIAMTPRVYAELCRLRENSPKDANGLVFGIVDTIKRSWASACKNAKIAGLRFHDTRHTAITRMIQAGISPTEVMKISGHSQMTTFLRYVNPAGDALRRAADALAAYHAAQTDTPTANELVN